MRWNEVVKVKKVGMWEVKIKMSKLVEVGGWASWVDGQWVDGC